VSDVFKVGFFGGSFDPIHYGHLNMAKTLAAHQGLEKVWFCPARFSPHKLCRTSTPVMHRLHMTSLAIDGIPEFTLLEIEAKRRGPSYTIDTLRELQKKKPAQSRSTQIYLILSDEALPGFFHWKEAEEIVKLAPLLVGSRFYIAKNPPQFEGSARINQSIVQGWHPTPVFPISSTEIREKIKRGEDCSELVPKKVLDYIYQNNLYS